jgi:FtsP/CotA-like multicopper oxidase with cupredoxin domain
VSAEQESDEVLVPHKYSREEAASARSLQGFHVVRKVQPPSRQEHLDRRDFFRTAGRLGLGSLLVAEAAALADCGGSAGPTTAPDASASGLASTPTRPPEIGGGTLVASVGSQSIWPGATTGVWTLGGSFPGPTIRIGRGAGFSARIENRLSEPTNVHWHGLASPPGMDGHPSDVIAPGQSRDIAFPIVDRAGTYWYHPHPDGRTARQVYGGMAGFFIVEDGGEAALGLPSLEYDVPLVVQDRRTSPDHSLTYDPSPMDLMAGVLGDTVLVNGRPDAVLPVAGTLYRLRLLNGSNARVYRLAFADGRSFHVIGTDGGLLELPMPVTSVDFGPGERVELLVDLTRDPVGTSILLKSLAFTVPAGMGGGMMPGMGGVAQGAALDVLRLRVERSGPAARVPATLVPFERLDPGRAEGTQAFILSMGMPPVAGAFTINGRSFDPRRIDVRARRGRLELWEVRNASSEPHPFHVHGASFQVISRTSGPLGAQDLGWKDTVLSWPGETVTLAIRFEQYAGLYVLHCHNLEHEDAGMMLNLEVS